MTKETTIGTTLWKHLFTFLIGILFLGLLPEEW
jgi:hypothetical protein